MATKTARFVCQQCAAVTAKWAGRCESCGAWNSISEEALPESTPKGLSARKGRTITFVPLEGERTVTARKKTGIEEFDRVAGGGLVAASALLVGGDPGIGKSTLLLQVTAKMAAGGARCAYISGEEAIDQLRLRAARLGLAKSPVSLAAATSVRDIVTTLDQGAPFDLVVIDSIQTMYIDSIESAPGTVSQVRTCAQELVRLAKRRGFCVVLVGHVTKDGQIAGPRVVEHMVDAVLYFEGERSHQFRILRGVKNRFGATDEIGVFEMSDKGLGEVPNPSALFLGEHDSSVSGGAIFAGIEGTRPMLVEIQSLLSPSALATPRRAVVGWDSARLAMIMAVMESRCGLALAGNDVYLNIAGGLKINEPAADLAVAAALASSLSGAPVPEKTVIFGEIGLSGEIRAVSHAQARLKEAAKLGFVHAIVPKRRARSAEKNRKDGETGLKTTEIAHLQDLLALFDAPPRRPSGPTPDRNGRAHG
ncbi:DNA repair protein RadA [Varunaivibrio sulfuroxidans]|uniref:DNA repair protein RadA n=1 Tax=Varunaivibrio sulfuroxidans TaxID=1773489 RepID=A0A4R3J2U2_9PROT|nr:DNA repair protein RadA [Varunaivibrio sulfuroxidans]TCS60138.1 DNA repair protein RadA/Sms [Varunaivibrio sulfuroxidans]WES30890.1 DNA repair protein RadA [Varunaivibrio sulfuroxidans]